MNTVTTPQLRIRTPEGITFAYNLAGLPTRFLAWFVDGAVILLIIIVLNIVTALIRPLSGDISNALGILAYLVVSLGYGIILEWGCRGQTLGKRLLGIRVMDIHGLNLHFSQVILRNILRPVDQLPGAYLVGAVTAFISPRCQRLGDLAANTVVILLPKTTIPDLDQIMAGKFNSFRQFPHLAARLRQKTSPQEADLALQALLRRNELADSSRVQLFEELTSHFKCLVEFPHEAVEGLSSEQYIRNIVDILYRDKISVNVSPNQIPQS